VNTIQSTNCFNAESITRQLQEVTQQINELKLQVSEKQTTTITVNIINAFGQEDLSHITPEFLEQCVRRTSKGHLELITYIYNNKRSNWNVKYTEKPNRLLVWNGNKYDMRMRNDVYDAAIKKSFNLMKNHYNENIEEFKNLSDSYIEHIKTYLSSDVQDDFEHIHRIQVDVKNVFKMVMSKRENITIPDTDDDEN
jgi:hypothetical protein